MKIKLNLYSWLIVLLLSIGLKAQSSDSKIKSRPNIVYIMSDDHSYQTISAYGSAVSKLAPTPNIDRIAKEGMVYNKAFVENSLCTPSRAALMTGLYSHQNGQRQLAEGIDSTKVFFTEILQKEGYQNAVVGKWHMSIDPKGFDYYHIFNDQGTYYNPAFKGTDTANKFIEEEGYSTDLVTKHSIEFLEKRDKNKPFVLLMHHKAPHRNWMPNGKYLDLYNDVDFPLPDTFYDDYDTRGSAIRTQKMSISKDLNLIGDLKLENNSKSSDKLDFSSKVTEVDRLTIEQRTAWDKHYKPRNEKFLKANLQGKELDIWKYQEYMRDYLRCVKSVDDSVGELLDYLKENNLEENTIVIYTSDQGFYMGEHNFFDKRFMYEESFRTPLLVKYPKQIKKGIKSDALVQNIDFAPTILSLAGIKKPAEMVGTTLEPTFTGKIPSKWRKDLYYHYYDYPTFHLVRKHDGVRTDRYKLIHFYGEGGIKGATEKYQSIPGSREYTLLKMLEKQGYITADPTINYNELYDLKTDPKELNNLYGKPGFEKITKDLQNRLDNYRVTLKVDEF